MSFQESFEIAGFTNSGVLLLKYLKLSQREKHQIFFLQRSFKSEHNVNFTMWYTIATSKNIIKYSFTWWINVFIFTTSMLLRKLQRILHENAVKPAQDCKLCYFLPFPKNECKTHILLSQSLKHNDCRITTAPKLLFQLDLTASNATKLQL